MDLQLLSSFGKRGVDNGLLTMRVDIEDTKYLSTYFDVAEFNPIFTAGKNSIAFNGTSFLAPDSEIKVQCLDSKGNSLYLERPVSKTQFTDVANYLVSIHVYNENYNGAGKLILVGTTTKNEIVRWVSNISIDKTLQNISKTRFYNTPTIEARSLLYPVIDNNIASQLIQIISFMGSFYTTAITPQKDTLQSYVNPKTTEIDYRLIYNSPDSSMVGPQVYPTSSMNTQMEGQSIFLIASSIQSPFSYGNKDVSTPSASFKIKKVIDSKTIQLDNAFFYPYGKNQIVSNINLGSFTSSYKWVAYNTQSDIYKKFTPTTGPVIYAKESYAEVVYRNLQPFTGFIARHKLYRKSLLYPGDYQLVVDESLGTRELLIDPVTTNKTYNLLGTFYNKIHIEKYWFTSSNDLSLAHSVTPRINAMTIGKTSPSYDTIDGTKYVIVKTDSVDTIPNDSTYWPYDVNQFNELQGPAYNSNFIDLKAGSLYALSMNISIEKSLFNNQAKLQFFFTSSIADIKKEKNYISPFGLKIGEISVNEFIYKKIFTDKQYFFFTPLVDYYGTLVIVPYKCIATISEVSLGVYGDYGFSPDSLTTKVPFTVHSANEGWQLKAELFDINSTLVYSGLNTIQTFDPSGESLFLFLENSNIDPSNISIINGDLTISQSLYLPNIHGCPPSHTQLLSWQTPHSYPPGVGEGGVCYTDLVGFGVETTNNLGTVTTKDYISVETLTDYGRSILVHYSGSISQGKRVFIESDGTKHTYS